MPVVDPVIRPGLITAALEVDPGAGFQQAGQSNEDIIHRLGIWRIDKDDVKGGGCRMAQIIPGIGADHFGTGFELLANTLECLCGIPIMLDQHRMFRAARKRLEPERAGPCKQIEAKGTREHGHKPVKQRLANPIRRRTHAG